MRAARISYSLVAILFAGLGLTAQAGPASAEDTLGPPARAQVEALAAQVNRDLGRSDPGHFAGAWVDSDPARGVVIGMSEGAPLDTSAYADKGAAISIVHPVRSVADLSRIRDEIVANRATLFGPGARLATVGIDTPANVVRLGIAGHIEVATRNVGSLYGKAVVVEERNTAPAEKIAGGSYLTDNTWACTAAFNIKEDPVTHLDGPKSRMSLLTAAHCFDRNASVYGGPKNRAGSVTFRSWKCGANPCHADVERVLYQPSPFLELDPPASTNVLTNGVAIRATDLGPYPVGSQMCKLGQTSGTTCGTVTQTGSVFCYQVDDGISGDACFDEGLAVTQDFCHGDSGGPVYSGDRARGIVSGRTWAGGKAEPACGGATGLMSTMAGVSHAGVDISRLDRG